MQEMQGAILPLAETYAADRPFLGVVLAGVFTAGSVAQLRSHGFGVLYFPHESLVKAFAVVGVDAAFDEDTKDSDIRRRLRIWDKVQESDRNKVVQKLRAIHLEEIDRFLRELEATLTRAIEAIFLLPLHGLAKTATNVADAIRLVADYHEQARVVGFCRYELNVRYTNGDEVRGSFAAKQDAIGFLKGFGQVE